MVNGGPPSSPLFLHGPPGTGKTHILNAVASLLESRFAPKTARVKCISASVKPPRFPDLEALVSDPIDPAHGLLAVIVDDAHLANEEDSAHLWSLSNKLTRSGAPLILAARTPPEEIFPANAHLRSRIVSGLILALEPPEDPIRMLIVDKMARDKNVRISREVCAYPGEPKVSKRQGAGKAARHLGPGLSRTQEAHNYSAGQGARKRRSPLTRVHTRSSPDVAAKSA